MPTQHPDHGAHKRLPTEVERLDKAVKYFQSQGDEKMLSQIVPQLDGAKERLAHAAKAAEFVALLDLSHEVNGHSYTVNDAINVVAKVLHEHEHHESGKAEVKSLYARAHGHLRGINDGEHCDEEKLSAPRDSHAELVEHLGLTDPAHIDAAKALFKKVTV
jgi:hypothetical protein